MLSRDCPVTVAGLSRDIGSFLPFSLHTLAITVGSPSSVKIGLERFYLFNCKSDCLWRGTSFSHAANEGGDTHTLALRRLGTTTSTPCVE